MRIGILSDTHDRRERAARAAEALADAGAEVLIHCGDLTIPEIVHDCSILPAYFVFGNNDEDLDDIREAISEIQGTCLEWGGLVELGGKQVAVTHGHLSKEIRRLDLSRPDYLLFGHSHVPTDHKDGPTRWVNPGALHRAEAWTVALLDTEADDLRFLNVR